MLSTAQQSPTVMKKVKPLPADAVSSQDAPEVADQATDDGDAAHAPATDNDIPSQASISAVPDELQSAQSTAEGFQAVQQSAAVTEPFRDPEPSRVLHICLGPLPHSHNSCTAFYFIRSQPGKLALADMDLLDCGLLAEGPSLQMLHQVKTVTPCFMSLAAV